MKRLSPKQVVLIKGIFDFSADTICYVSRDRKTIDVYVGNYMFFFKYVMAIFITQSISSMMQMKLENVFLETILMISILLLNLYVVSF